MFKYLCKSSSQVSVNLQNFIKLSPKTQNCVSKMIFIVSNKTHSQNTIFVKTKFCKLTETCEILLHKYMNMWICSDFYTFLKFYKFMLSTEQHHSAFIDYFFQWLRVNRAYFDWKINDSSHLKNESLFFSHFDCMSIFRVCFSLFDYIFYLLEKSYFIVEKYLHFLYVRSACFSVN